MNPLTNPLLARSLAQVTATLQYFAYQPNFLEQLRVAFGDDFDSSVALGIRQLFQAGDFSLIPDLQVLSNGELGAANGAYAGELDEIFVSSDFLAGQGDIAAIANLLLEEFGHKLDRLLNGNVDSPGDEGAIFAALAQGQILSTDALAQLRAEDDHRTILVDGKAVEIEMEIWTGTPGDDDHTGVDASNNLFGLAGNDTLYGGTGNDLLEGGTGNDGLYSGNGDDELSGNAGNDTLSGGAGNDLLYGGAGNNGLYGGIGNDSYYFNAAIDLGANIIAEAAPFANGIDGLYFNSTTTQAINVNLGSTTIQTVAPGLQITLSGDIENVIGGGGNDFIIGNSLDNSLYGNAGNDILIGGAGNDRLDGDTGNDTYIFNTAIDTGVDRVDEFFGSGIDTLDFGSTITDPIYVNLGSTTIQTVATSLQITLSGDIENVIGGYGNDTIIGSTLDNTLDGRSGNDYLDGWVGNDSLSGGAGNDTLYGWTGNDTLNGGAGNDILNGEADNDTYIFNAAIDLGADIINEAAPYANGIDTLDFSSTTTTGVSVSLSTTTIQAVATGFQITINGSIENVIGGFLSDNIRGNSLANTLYGNAGSDYLDGYDGDDNLYGGDGGDQIGGGNGNDNLYGGDGDDVISGDSGNDNLYGGAGNDTYRINAGYETGAILIDETLGDGIDTLDFIGYTTQAISVNLGNTAIQTVAPGLQITINGAIENVKGSSANDTMIGNSLNNRIEGGRGADSMSGGTGNDTYVVDNASDLVTEAANSGTDTVESSITYTLTPNVENLLLTVPISSDPFVPNPSPNINGTGNALDNIITGNSGNNILNGGFGNDTLIGGVGTDTLIGGDGNDNFYGGIGIDNLIGGVGDDTYFIDHLGDIITEATGEGTDTISSSLSYTLGNNVENLTLTGIDNYLNGTGNALDNIITLSTTTANFGAIIDGGAGNDTIVGGLNSTYSTYTGGDGNDSITGGNGNLNFFSGGAGNDTLIGGSGRESFDPGTGADSIDGGIGEDYFSIDNSTDTVANNINYTTLTNGTIIGGANDGTTFKNVENISIKTGSGNDYINISGATGGFGASGIHGGAGNDTIVGSLTGDFNSYQGDDGNDNITGGNTFDILYGGEGNDTLNGGGYDDDLNGGDGNDTYVINANTDTGIDTIDEIETGGIDTLNFQSSSTAININLSQLTTQTIATNVELAFDGLSINYIENVIGGSGNDTMTGNALNNRLDGGTGADTMSGGTGNDTYIVDNIGDIVTEAAGAGTDTVESSITYILTPNVENLTLVGTANIDGTGNNLQNTITGNSGNNILKGISSGDTLIGGAGDDTLDGGNTSQYSTYFYGGTGNDIYISSQINDVITEAANEGIDTVQASFDRTLSDNVENLTLVDLAITGTGNALDNIINGSDFGNNTLNGLAGNDTLDGGGGSDNLNGGAGIDTAVFSGNFTDYTITYSSNNLTYTIADTRLNSDSIDTLTSVEFFQFADKVIINNTNDNIIANIEQIGAVKLALVNGKYAAIDPLTNAFTSITYNNNPVTPTTFAGWSVIGAERVGDIPTGDIEYMWKDNNSGQFWYSTNTNTGSAVVGAALATKETDFAQDFNNDGIIGAKTTIEQIGAVELAVVNNQYMAIDKATNAVTPILYNTNPVSPTTFAGWSVIGAERVGDIPTGTIEYMWKDNTTGQFFYSTNTNNGGYVAGAALLTKEVDFQQDFTGDGIIGAKTTVEQIGSIELALANNQYIAIDTATNAVTSILFNGNPVSPTTFAGWSVIGAERVGDTPTGEIEYMWKDNNNGQLWYSTNTNSGGTVFAGGQLLSKEVDFQQDFNNDRVIGLISLETAGTTTLALDNSGNYIANNGGANVGLLYTNAPLSPNTFPGWSVIGAEIVGADVKAMWKNGSQYWYSTNTDNGAGVTDTTPYEFTFKQDFDNDTFIAQVSTPVNDTLTGTAGKDAFVFKGNPLLSLFNAIGLDTVNNFTPGGQDSLFLSKANFTALATTAGNPLVTADFATVTTDAATALGNAIVYNSANGKLFYDANGAAAGFGAGGQFAQLASGLGLTGNDFKAIA
jgi:Ca2+-binding RTX toxin-like protein